MSYIKKRVPRKSGTRAQEIIKDEQSLSSWINENINAVIFVAGTAVFILVVTLGIVWVKSEKQEDANAALSVAMAVYQTTTAQLPDEEDPEENRERLEVALESLEGVATEYPGMKQGHMANLFKANVLFRLGRYQEAAATVEELEDINPVLASEINAYYLLARSYEAMEDFTSAIETYKTAKDSARGNMLAVTDLDIARCHELSGNTETAIAIYEEVVTEYPDTVYATRAGKKLAILGISDQETH